MFLQSSLEIIFAVVIVFGRITDFRFRKESLFVDDIGTGMGDGMNLGMIFGNSGGKLRISRLLLLAVNRLIEI